MRWPSRFLFLALLIYGIGFSFGPTLFSGFRQMQTDAGDTVLNHYFLEHSYRWISQADYIGTYWSPAFFYPEKGVLGYSDNLLGAAPLYWLLRCFADEVLAYQLWMMIGFALNFAAMAVALRWFGSNHSLCALGAFLFAFGTPAVQQIGHQQLGNRWWTPFAIWYAWQFLVEPSGTRLFRCLFCVTGQFLTAVYVGWFLAYGLGWLGFSALALDKQTRQRLWKFGRERPLSIAGTVLFNAALAAIIIVPYLRINSGYRRSFGETLGGSPHWNNWLSVPPGTLWQSLLEPFALNLNGERYLFGGLANLILFATLLFVLIRRFDARDAQRLLLKSSLLTLVVMWLTTASFWVGDEGGSIWYLVYHVVPGAKAIRCTARIYLIFYPILCIAGLLALQKLMAYRAWPARENVKAMAAFIALAVIENYYPQRNDPSRFFEQRPFYDRARQVAGEIRGADAAYGITDRKTIFYQHELTMMWAGLYADVPVLNGYSGRGPNDYPTWEEPPGRDQLRKWLGENWNGRLAIVQVAEPPIASFLEFDR